MKTSSGYTMEHLYNLADRMKRADIPKTGCTTDNYSNALNLAIDDMPKMSAKHIGLLMKALYAAYQMGTARMDELYRQERDRRETSSK